jgi:hypothetical protein
VHRLGGGGGGGGVNLIVFDMFRTTKCSSLVSLYKQLCAILSCIYISDLVVDRMCLIQRVENNISELNN